VGHQDGKHAYLGSGSGGDVLYAIDISDPTNPTVTIQCCRTRAA
jgi:Tfp pilus tip-associated adhesin PilY1